MAAEAMLNGIPPVVSDRGGLPEACCGGGIVLSLPGEITPESRVPPAASAVEPWLKVIERLCDDEGAYRAASERARAASEQLRPERMLSKCLEFFDGVRRKEG